MIQQFDGLLNKFDSVKDYILCCLLITFYQDRISVRVKLINRESINLLYNLRILYCIKHIILNRAIFTIIIYQNIHNPS